jgi:hypothetical protein
LRGKLRFHALIERTDWYKCQFGGDCIFRANKAYKRATYTRRQFRVKQRKGDNQSKSSFASGSLIPFFACPNRKNSLLKGELKHGQEGISHFME